MSLWALRHELVGQVKSLQARFGAKTPDLEAGRLLAEVQRKLHNLRRDPRIAIAVHATTRNTAGLTEYLVLYGRARVTEGGAPELLQELAHTYIGPHVKFPSMPNPPPGFVTRVTVERIGGVGPWAPGGP